MVTYSEFQPTEFDSKGLNGDENGISDFLVVPVSRTRDSGIAADSNFVAALALLGGESDSVQVHRFNHWGPGWFEIIVIDPSDEDLVNKAEDIEKRLEDYPFLDDDDFFVRERDEAIEVLDSYTPSNADPEKLPDDWKEKLYSELFDNGAEYTSDSGWYLEGVDLELLFVELGWAEDEEEEEHDPESCGCSYVGNDAWSCGHIDNVPNVPEDPNQLKFEFAHWEEHYLFGG